MNRNPIILVVDDSEVERRLIGGLLERSSEVTLVKRDRRDVEVRS